MIDVKDMNMESESALMPTPDCFDENGKIIKEKYMRQFPDFNKHDKKKTKKKVFKFIEHNERCKHYRLEIHQTPYGCNFHFNGEQYVPTEAQKETFFKSLWEAIESCVVSVKAFDFNVANDYHAMEIWGINDQDESVILFVYPYDSAVTEIGEYDS